ncbi:MULTISPECIES: hypothetical protein [unclassified Paraflavitalea]|uniref:hypothetical protein n=1 Tax=unclassified Paraflavitalea TaxID=2798305 RepID=UPI003D3399DA
MSKRSFWLRLFNVYPSEWWVVKRLYLLLFLQGAGAAFFFTSGFAQFLEKHPVTDLAYVFMLSAVMLWVVGYFYAKFEHKLSFRQFNITVLLFMTISMLLLRIGNFYYDNYWYYYILLGWFNVLYMLNNLSFWGIAATLFDLRQSKRLFAVISAGDIPAKFVGYTLASIFVSYTGTQNLLFLGSLFMFGAFILFERVERSGRLHAAHHHQNHHEHHHNNHHAAPKPLSRLVSDFTTNSYIRGIAIVSVMAGASILLINYGFYAEVKKAFHDDVALAKFIALFFAALRVFALFTKMVFASRLTSKLGILSTLLITPIAMLILVAATIFAGWFSTSETIMFYLFGVIAILVEVLRTSFSAPVLLTLMQPLGTFERLRAHNIVKGIMDPFASLFCGLFLLTLLFLHQKIGLLPISYMLIVLGVVWVIALFSVNKQYVLLLLHTISTRFFSNESFELRNEQLMKEILLKMNHASDLEILSMLRMIISNSQQISESIVLKLLHHPSEKVQLESIRLIRQFRLLSMLVLVKERLNEELSPEIKKEAVFTLAALTDRYDAVQTYIDATDPEIKKAAITGSLISFSIAVHGRAEAWVDQTLKDHPEKALELLDLLNTVKDEYGYPSYGQFLNSEDPAVVNAALRSIGKAVHADVLSEAANLFEYNTKLVSQAFLQAGSKSLIEIAALLKREDLSVDKKDQLISICGKLNDPAAVGAVLMPFMEEHPYYTLPIVKSLHRVKYRCTHAERPVLEAVAKRYQSYVVELYAMWSEIIPEHDIDGMMQRAMSAEVDSIRDMLLQLFEMMYEPSKIREAKYAIFSNQKERIANGLELIEITVRKDIGILFSQLFEPQDIRQKVQFLKIHLSKNPKQGLNHLVNSVLQEVPMDYMDWTKACSLFIGAKRSYEIEKSYLYKYSQVENPVLKETAVFAMKNSNN